MADSFHNNGRTHDVYIYQHENYKGARKHIERRGTEAQRRLLYRAKETAIKSCMNRRGFAHTPNPYQNDTTFDGLPANSDIDSLETAQWRGYEIAERLDNGEVRLPLDVNEEALVDLSPEAQRQWNESLSGAPLSAFTPGKPVLDPSVGVASKPSGDTLIWRHDSCLAYAERAVDGDDVAYTNMILQRDALYNEIVARVEQDPAYLAGIERWRSCMLRYGLSAASPGQAPEPLLQAYRSQEIEIAELRQKEIRHAVADATCHQEAGLRDIHMAVQQRIEQTVKSEHAETWSAMLALQSKAIRRATALATADNEDNNDEG